MTTESLFLPPSSPDSPTFGGTSAVVWFPPPFLAL
jgi:hypothetical protein